MLHGSECSTRPAGAVIWAHHKRRRRDMAMNYLAIVTAAVAAWIVGGVYYSVLSKQWLAAQGMTVEEAKAKHEAVKGTARAWLPFVLVFVAELIIAWILAGLLGHLGMFTVRGGVIS